jgi:hypothetical protein
MTSHSDADVFGFRASDIYDFLDNHGLKLNRDARAHSGPGSAAAQSRSDSSPRATAAGERATFSAITAARRAEFISYREAMKKLRESTGEALNDIATGLKSHGLHEKHMAHLAGSEQAVRRITGSDDLTALLDETIENGGIIAAWVGPDDQADPDRSGWMRREFVAALSDAALPCPNTLLDDGSLVLSTQEEPEPPDWVLPYKGRGEISLGDAAAILADCGPIPLPKNMGWTAEGKAKIAAWRDALIDAIGRDFDERLDFQPEIKASGWSSNRDTEQMLSHSDIRAWCAKRGHKWPIPELNPQPATASEALAEIERMKREIERLRVELAEAREGAYPEDSDQWPEELGIALTAWRAAVNNAMSSGKKPGAYIRAWLDEAYPNQAGSERHKRIAIVANWDKTPGPTK